MGTQTGALFCCLAILSRRLKIGAIQTAFESGLIDKCQHGRVFVTIFIIPADDHFFNYAFKNITVKSIKHFIFFQRPTKLCNPLFHSAVCFSGFLQALALFLELFDLAA